MAHSQVFDVHVLVPRSGQLEQILAVLVSDVAADGIVGAAEVALGLELDISDHAGLGAFDVGVVAELVLHRAEQYSAHVDVGLCDEAA